MSSFEPSSRVYLYVLTFANGKEYVGVTSSPVRRLSAHRSNKSLCHKVRRAVKKYGADSFEMQLLQGFADHVKAFKAERKEIKKRKSDVCGYNLSPGGGRGAQTQVKYAGKQIGNLYVIGDIGKRHKPSGQVLWLCRCVCGAECLQRTGTLNGSNTPRKSPASCGCSWLNRLNATSVTHGHTKHRIQSGVYKAWLSMRRKGINVSEQWGKFENFYKDMGDRPNNLCLCRKDKSKGYSASNCFWGKRKDVSASGVNLRQLTAYGETKSLAQWSEDTRVTEIGLTYTQIRARVNILKWSDDRTLTTPSRSNQRGKDDKSKKRHRSTSRRICV